LVNFCEIQYGGLAIEDDLNAILFNPTASTVTKWQMIKRLGGCKACITQCGTMKFCMAIDIKR
jgi:hypothetical protein